MLHLTNVIASHFDSKQKEAVHGKKKKLVNFFQTETQTFVELLVHCFPPSLLPSIKKVGLRKRETGKDTEPGRGDG